MKLKNYLVIGLIIFLLGGIIGVYLFLRPAEKLGSKDHQVEVSASELFRIYDNNELEGNDKFLDKIILVRGKILSISDKIIVIGDKNKSVSCKIDENEILKIQTYNIGQEINIKGLCIGMGLFDVILTKCLIVE